MIQPTPRSSLSGAPDPADVTVTRLESPSRTTGRHNHPQGQLYGTMAGTVSVGTERGRWVIPPANAIWLPPHHGHDLESHGPFRGWSVYVAEPRCAGLPAGPRVIQVSGLMREAVARASEWTSAPRTPAQERIAGVILDEIGSLPEQRLDLPMPADARLARIAKAIAAEPADGRRMEDWAAWAGIAPRTLTRLYRAETGFTFKVWRQRARLLRALEQLAAGNTVTTVAIDLGYESVSSFIELFRAHFGVTPGRFYP